MHKPTIIVCSAQRNANFDIIASPRHWGLIPKLIPFLQSEWILENLPHKCFGFLDTNSNFLDKKEAYIIAKNQNQILYDSNNEILISENLYSNKRNPIIVCAANYNIKLDILICGIRHYDNIMRKTIQQFNNKYINTWFDDNNVIQGFIDQYENFYTREDALKLAIKNTQIKYRCGGDNIRLFSENLY